jgi:predicted transcriptional regulator
MIYTDAVMRYRRALNESKTVAELAKKLNQSYHGTYATLRRLEKKGLVTRTVKAKSKGHGGSEPGLYLWCGN